MNRRSPASIVLSVCLLAIAPIAIAFGVNGMPSFSGIRQEKTADIVGVWVMTWGLIALTVVASIVVAWLAWSAQDAAERLDSWTGPEAQPDTTHRRFVA
jgi:hypothetical protein